MQLLRDILEHAQKNRVAIGYFNVADLVLLKAVFSSAQELNVPVLVGASAGERAFMGVKQIAALVRSIREEFDFPIFLNADHTHSLPDALEAAKAGFDAVVFDLSALPFEENARQTTSRESLPSKVRRRLCSRCMADQERMTTTSGKPLPLVSTSYTSTLNCALRGDAD
jgi:fructose/tagatose bisphosphate aldolase